MLCVSGDNREQRRGLTPYTNPRPLRVPISHSLLPALSALVSPSTTPKKKKRKKKKVSPHGTPSKHNYSPSGRLLLKETTYIPALMSDYNWPFLPPPTSFFNIQIGCFVWLNWRLIAHTIWRRLFKKTVALFFFFFFFPHCVPVIKVRD